MNNREELELNVPSFSLAQLLAPWHSSSPFHDQHCQPGPSAEGAGGLLDEFRVHCSYCSLLQHEFRVHCLLFRVHCLLFRVHCLEFIHSSLFIVQSSLFIVQGSLFRVQSSSEFTVPYSLFRVKILI